MGQLRTGDMNSVALAWVVSVDVTTTPMSKVTNTRPRAAASVLGIAAITLPMSNFPPNQNGRSVSCPIYDAL